MLTFPVISFFFNDTATTEIYTLSLHDALPIFGWLAVRGFREAQLTTAGLYPVASLATAALAYGLADVAHGSGFLAVYLAGLADRKSTRLNSSHAHISYAVFCLQKKNKTYVRAS